MIVRLITEKVMRLADGVQYKFWTFGGKVPGKFIRVRHTELRKWFGHDPDKWKEFQKRYHKELKENKEQVSLLKEQLKKGTVTLVYGAKDEEHNEALLLKKSFR